jgi:hypothetical protein
MASMYRVCVCAGAATEDMREGLVGLGIGCGAGGLDGLFDARAGLFTDVVEPRTALLQSPGRDEERVVVAPAGRLLLGLVRLRVALVVAVPAVGLELEQDGALSGAAALGGFGGRGVDGLHVVAVDRVRLDAVGRGPVGDPRDPGHPAAVGALRVDVVLAGEDHRQVPDGAEVERLVERALVDGALAEEGDGDAVLLQVLARQAGTGGQRHARADDRVGAEDALAGVRDVHRAALAAAQPGGLGEELGHHAVEVGALGEDVAVAAVGGGEVVVVAQRGAHAGGDRLLAERGVHEAGDLAVAVELGHPGFEGADERHPFVELEQGHIGETARQSEGNQA